jgi:hypothetical protein
VRDGPSSVLVALDLELAFSDVAIRIAEIFG